MCDYFASNPLIPRKANHIPRNRIGGLIATVYFCIKKLWAYYALVKLKIYIYIFINLNIEGNDLVKIVASLWDYSSVYDDYHIQEL